MKNVLFLAVAGKNWLGGVYYIKNQIMQLLSYKPARRNLNIYLYTGLENEKEYSVLNKYPNVNIIFRETLDNNVLCKLGKSIYTDWDVEILYLVLRYNISYIFPYFPTNKINKIFLHKKSISWIPDFQHEHLTKFFSLNEIARRNEEFMEIAKGHNKLVLSSKDAYRDYIKKYAQYDDEVYIIPFCSMLDKEMVLTDRIEEVKQKYGIKNEYFIICNQLWMHKNHLLAFEALKKAIEKEPDIHILCTGALLDFRNKKYYHQVKKFIVENGLEENIYMLGLIEKNEQIQLLKGAVALIQPSLFEGWGTGVEDAKTLGKKILMSDIAVHYEQKNENSMIFNRDDANELAELLIKTWNHEKYAKKRNMYSVKRAKEYGAKFYDMLCK